MSAVLLLLALTIRPALAATPPPGDWDEVIWAGLKSPHTQVWRDLQFASLPDFLFPTQIVSYTSPTPTSHNLTFPSGAWLHLSLLETIPLRQTITLSATASASLLGAPLRARVFASARPWAGRPLHALLHSGYRIDSGSSPAARARLAALLRAAHDAARAARGAHPCSDHFRTYGGTCNNPHHPRWGACNAALKRMDAKADPAFVPGSNDFPADMPNARTVSSRLFRQTASHPSVRKVTMLAVFWGQFIDHDVGLTPESGGTVVEEHMDIAVEDAADVMYERHHGALEFTRSRGVMDGEACCGSGIKERFPRDQVNAHSSFIDGSHVYGCDRERVHSLRGWEGGRLLEGEMSAAGGRYFLPRNREGEIGVKLDNAGSDSEDFFAAGDVRANEQPVLACLHTLFLREHNRLAKALKQRFPCWKDEKVFQYARKIVAAQIQFITYKFFLPAILGSEHELPEYSEYKPDVDPSIANIFSSAAYRFGHSAVADTLTIMGSGKVIHPKHGIRLQEVFFNPWFVKEVEIEPILLGSSHQVAETVDTKVVDSLQNELFKNLTGGIDLVALNIQRGRDHGVPKYNAARQMYGLTKKTSFADLTSDRQVQNILQSLYGSIDNVDCFVGGLAENHINDSELGELFHTIVRDQFIRLRDGDRFYYEDLKWPKEVAETEAVHEIEKGSLRLQDIIVRNSGGSLRLEDFSTNVFRM